MLTLEIILIPYFRPEKACLLVTKGFVTMCNGWEKENILPFLGSCVILNNIRFFWFGKWLVDEQELMNILNTEHWTSLVNYVPTILKFRRMWFEEFNFWPQKNFSIFFVHALI